MNWKRGFKRMFFVLAIFVAILFAGLSIVMVLLIRSEAQSNLRWEEKQYKEKYDRHHGMRLSELLRQDAMPEEALSKEIALAEAKLKELQKGFWVSLSKGGLVGLCGAVGLIGGIIGFVMVWLVYKFLEWLVLGFCDNNRLPPEKT